MLGGNKCFCDRNNNDSRRYTPYPAASCNRITNANHIASKAIADSGALGHYACVNSPCVSTRQAQPNERITVTLPNDMAVTSTQVGQLPNEQLPLSACAVRIFPDFKNKMLMSLGQFCDAGMKMILTKTSMSAITDDERQTMLQGTSSPQDGMWHLDLENTNKMTKGTRAPTINKANSACEIKKKEELAKFFSAAMWNPAPSAWLQAIEVVFFATWSGITPELIRKHLEPTVETTKGHLWADRKNARSTKAIPREHKIKDKMSSALKS